MQGRRIIQASWIGTAVFTVAAVVGGVVAGWPRKVAVVTDLTLFVIGCGLFLAGYWQAVQRSRTNEIGIGGLFFLAGKGTAPGRVKVHLLGSMAAQLVIAIVTASVWPFSELAFGLLVPVFGLGCTGLWSARYGHFGPRLDPKPTAAAVRRAMTRPADESDASPQDAPSGDEIGQNAGHG